jgi:hypothetical protein
MYFPVEPAGLNIKKTRERNMFKNKLKYGQLMQITILKYSE